MRTFPFVSCEPQCATYSLDVHRQCQSKQQFGCLYRRCSAHNFQCVLNPEVSSSNDCPDGEVQVRQVTLRPNFPVEFDLAVNIKGFDLDVVLLIDASESAKPRLNAVKNELSSFVRQLNGTAHVGVAVYGGEDSFDEEGMQVLSPAEENVQSALDALENIPTFPDGVRTTLTALSSIQRYPNPLSLRLWRTIVVLIGDTAGREPECSLQMDRDRISGTLFDFSNGISVIPASLDEPGLDGALPPIQPCANSYLPTEAQPVAAGQASKIAEDTGGEVVSSITATVLLGAIDSVRRNPNRAHQTRPGAEIYISTASVVPVNLPYYEVVEPINGCEDKVIVTTTGIPEDFVSEPAHFTGKVKLDLPAGICQRGPFSCTIRVMDHERGHETMSHWSRPMTYYKKISVRAC
ncbi:von Willebrand factor A-like protein [Gracilaria domingensis]|nr:von Willebrand factor A-like protein [Gracilaria domingensis]